MMKKLWLNGAFVLLSFVTSAQGKDFVNIKKKGGLFGLYREVSFTYDGCVENCASGNGQSQSFTLNCQGVGTNRCKTSTVMAPDGTGDHGNLNRIFEVQEKLVTMMEDIDREIAAGQRSGTQGAKVEIVADPSHPGRIIVIRSRWTHDASANETSIRFELIESARLH